MLLKANISQSNKAGFALIEILVAIIIIGIMVGISIPRFFSAGNISMEKFVSALNALAQDGIVRAAQQNQAYKLLFNFKSYKVQLIEIATEKSQEKIIDQIEMPKSIILQDLFINRKSEQGKEEAWLFINPDGTTQEFIMNLIDTKIQEKSPSRGGYGLVLNPFSGQFKLYDTFQKSIA